MKDAHCKKCNKKLSPARVPNKSDGIARYVGFHPCPCDMDIMTDYGIVYTGTEEHSIIVNNGWYSINDLLQKR